jgi:predicted NBD/HSP70 family sugar kinase
VVLPSASAIVFDLGGTHLRCACSIPGGELVNLTRTRIRSFREGPPSSEIWSEILDKIVDYTRESGTLVEPATPVALSFPGPLNEDGRIVNAPTVSGLDGQIPDIRSEIARRTGRSAYLLNDVSAAALYLAGHCPWERFMVITISSGIGSKICHRNSHGVSLFDKGPFAGEIGHLTVDQSDSAPRCDCGGVGHLGAIASGRGVERRARRRAAVDPESFMRSICRTRLGATAETLSNEEHFVPAVRAGDAWALDVLREASEPLARILNTVIFALGLQGILVIGGFAFSIGPVYLELLNKLIRQGWDYSAIEVAPPAVEFGKMCEEACLRGAGVYALAADQPS